MCVLHNDERSRSSVPAARFSAITVLVDAHFMLYSLVVCYEVHIKLAHINFPERGR